MSPTLPRRAAVLPSMSATLRLVAVLLSRRPRGCRQPVCWYAIARGLFYNRVATAMRWRILGTAPDVFLQCYGRYDEQPQPKTDQKIQQSSPTPKVAAVPCVVLAVFVAASSDRLKSKT